MISPTSAFAKLLWSSTASRSRTRSPGAVRGTNTARPSASRPTPSPPAAMPVIMTTSLTQTLPQPRVPPGSRAVGRSGGHGRLGLAAPLVRQQRRGDGHRPFQPAERRGGEQPLAHALEVRDVHLPLLEVGVVHHPEVE